MVAGVGVANGHGWIACVPETSPDDLSNQGICDRTPQVLDHLVEIVAAAGCAQVTANHLARAEKLDLSGICMAPLPGTGLQRAQRLAAKEKFDKEISQILVRESFASYRGSCLWRYSVARNDSRFRKQCP